MRKGRKANEKDSAQSALPVLRKSQKTTPKYHTLVKLRFGKLLQPSSVYSDRGSLGEVIYNGNNPDVWAFMGLAVWSSNEPQSSVLSPTCLFSLFYVRKKNMFSLYGPKTIAKHII